MEALGSTTQPINLRKTKMTTLGFELHEKEEERREFLAHTLSSSLMEAEECPLFSLAPTATSKEIERQERGDVCTVERKEKVWSNGLFRCF